MEAQAPSPELKEIEQKIHALHREKSDAIAAQDFEKAAQLRDIEADYREQAEQERAKQKSANDGRRGTVTEEDIANVVSGWTGIPVTRLTEAESERLLKLEEKLHERVVGQDEAVSAVARAIRRGRVGIKDPKRPIGSFLFLGPTGVGKTELCKTLAEAMFGDENAMIRIDMSEYMERHTVSRLVGSPPGYVGYDEGGQLTEKVRRKPYSVVLFDEIEKAHEDVWNILLQILEDGVVTDAQGRRVDFKNTILIMTSNAGSDIIQGYMERLPEASGVDVAAVAERRRLLDECRGKVLEVLRAGIRPEFLNRIDEIIMFDPLTRADIRDILHIQMDDLRKKLSDSGITVRFTPAFEDWMVDHGYDPAYGARPVKRLMQRELVNLLAKSILDGTVHKESVITVDVAGSEVVLRDS